MDAVKRVEAVSMVTTCPACGTRFRFNPVDVAAHGGEGRCSVCRHIFNALDHVTPLDDAPVEPLPAAEATVALEASNDMVIEEPVPEPPPAALPIEMEADTLETTALQADLHKVLEPLPETLFVRNPSRLPRFFKQLTMICVLLTIALIQIALFYRQQVINILPSSYPLLAGLCQPLACTAPLPRQAARIAIEDYRLLSHPDFQDVLILESTLRNHARYPQAYPALELTLTDQVDAPVALKNLAPEEYQPNVEILEYGIPPGATVNVQVYLSVSGLQSSKYKLITKNAAQRGTDS